ncbi:MAG: arginine--tRNA ligase [Bacilli bacterium]|jgi:arginyl-tRNA synthetase|nr:arginine--tRNA ligase [Bacilli bacterium]HHU24743.1 arginine--tRNA ligase [Acholeplasmataceae bacterium]
MTVNVLSELRKTLTSIVTAMGCGEVIAKDPIVLEIPRDKAHGDYATNIAMRLAKTMRKNPLAIANQIVERIPKDELYLTEVSVAGAGFINFTFDASYLLGVVEDVINLKEQYGNVNIGNGQKMNLEFVSANPTGYLHVGHGRGAAYGDSLARIMIKAGFDVHREHYVNDAGNQITNLALSIFERYKEQLGLPFQMEDGFYFGKEIIELAKELVEKYNDELLSYDEKKRLSFLRKYGTDALLANLKSDLKAFGVEFDTWFSEQSLYDNQEVEIALHTLTEKGYTYEQDGAVWLKTSLFGDEKDRVIIKSDGTYTYVLPDIAYHVNKLNRGFDHLIDVLGADHHGYIERIKAGVEMAGGKSGLIDIEILQMVRVIEDGVEIKMSKRSGKAITLADLMEQVGTSALRYFYVSKSLGTHMDLDLDLMRKQSNENPVFYAQYAHARICSVIKNLAKNNIPYQLTTTFDQIDHQRVKGICKTLLKYPSIIEEAASKRLVHKVTQFIDELSYELHSYYNDEKIITDNKEETLQKVTILTAVKTVLKDALSLIGVEAPEAM